MAAALLSSAGVRKAWRSSIPCFTRCAAQRAGRSARWPALLTLPPACSLQYCVSPTPAAEPRRGGYCEALSLRGGGPDRRLRHERQAAVPARAPPLPQRGLHRRRLPAPDPSPPQYLPPLQEAGLLVWRALLQRSRSASRVPRLAAAACGAGRGGIHTLSRAHFVYICMHSHVQTAYVSVFSKHTGAQDWESDELCLGPHSAAAASMVRCAAAASTLGSSRPAFRLLFSVRQDVRHPERCAQCRGPRRQP